MHEAALKECGFAKAGDIHLTSIGVTTSVHPDCSWVGGVYAWIVEGEGGPEVLYIGKAGRTLVQRCKQHEGGFSGRSKSKAGLRNGEALRTLLAQEKRLTIWARQSDRVRLFGVDVSLCSTEEEALIRRFDPLLNRAAKRR